MNRPMLPWYTIYSDAFPRAISTTADIDRWEATIGSECPGTTRIQIADAVRGLAKKYAAGTLKASPKVYHIVNELRTAHGGGQRHRPDPVECANCHGTGWRDRTVYLDPATGHILIGPQPEGSTYVVQGVLCSCDNGTWARNVLVKHGEIRDAQAAADFARRTSLAMAGRIPPIRLRDDSKTADLLRDWARGTTTAPESSATLSHTIDELRL